MKKTPKELDNKVVQAIYEARGKRLPSLIKDMESKLNALGLGKAYVCINKDERKDKILPNVILTMKIRGHKPLWAGLYYRNSWTGWYARETHFYRRGRK